MNPWCPKFILKKSAFEFFSFYCILSHDVASVSDIMPCNKIDKSLVVYRFRYVMYIH